MKKTVIMLMAFLMIVTGCEKDTPAVRVEILAGAMPEGTEKLILTTKDSEGAIEKMKIEGSSFEIEKGVYDFTLRAISGRGEELGEAGRRGVEIDGAEKIVFPFDKERERKPDMASLPEITIEEADEDMEEEIRKASPTVEIWTSRTGRSADALAFILDRFNEENPWNITARAVWQGDENALHMKALSSLLTGSNPHIVEDEAWRTSEYLPSGRVMELTSYFEDGTGLTSETWNGVSPYLLERGMSYEDEGIYSVAPGMDTEVLYINKEFLIENGFDLPRSERELIALMEEARDMENKPMFGVDEGRTGLTGPVSWGASEAEKLFDEDDLSYTFNFYDAFKKAVDDGLIRGKGDDESLLETFRRGDVKFYVGLSEDAGSMSAMPFEVAVLPLTIMKEPTVLVGGSVFTGFSTGDKVQDTATSIVLEYLLSAEASAIDSSMTGRMPINSDAWNMLEPADTGIEKTLRAEKKYTGKEMVSYPAVKVKGKLERVLRGPVEGMLLKVRSIDSLVAEALVEMSEL